MLFVAWKVWRLGTLNFLLTLHVYDFRHCLCVNTDTHLCKSTTQRVHSELKLACDGWWIESWSVQLGASPFLGPVDGAPFYNL